MRRSRWIKDQRGSVTVLIFGVMVGVVAFSIVLFDIYAVYVGRRIAQSAADAAALGALEVLRKASQDEAEAEANRRLQARVQEIQAEVATRVAAWERDRRAELTRKLKEEREEACPPPAPAPPPSDAPPPEPCPDYSGIGEEVDRVIADERPGVRAEYFRQVVKLFIRHVDLQNAIIQATTPELGWLIAEFLSARDLACVVKTAGTNTRPSWEATIDHFATVNGGQVAESEFPYDGRVAIAVTVPVRIRLLVFDSFLPEDLRFVRAEAAVQIDRFGPFPVDVRAAGC